MVHLFDESDKYDNDETGISIRHSKYYNESYFINTIATYHKSLTILSLNAQSLNAKFDEINIFITTITRTSNITVLCVQETWLSDESNTSVYNIPGYSLLSKGKHSSNHGGLIT